MFKTTASQLIRIKWKIRILGVATPLGMNCPPAQIFKQVIVSAYPKKPSYKKFTARPFKLKFREEYKRHLLSLKFVKLTSMQEQAFCPLFIRNLSN